MPGSDWKISNTEGIKELWEIIEYHLFFDDYDDLDTETAAESMEE